MAEIYDNWERLVTAVLRKESDKQTAFRNSTDSSITSSSSSSFDLSPTSTPQLDRDQSLVVRERPKLPMDYSDLTLDHLQWKAMLPPGKRELVFRSASLSFSLDERTGKNCFLLGSTRLIISSRRIRPSNGPLGGDNDCWESESHPKTGFSEVAKLKNLPYLNVKGSIERKMLSPKTLYAAYFVFGFTEMREEEHKINLLASISYLGSENYRSKSQSGPVNLKLGKDRADGWKEMQLAGFYNGRGGNGTLIVELQVDIMLGRLSGLIVEGIEFRPLKGKRNTRGKVLVLPNSKISS